MKNPYFVIGLLYGIIGVILSSINNFAIAGILYPASTTIFFIPEYLFFNFSYNSGKALESGILPGLTTKSNTKLFLSHAVLAEYANTFLCSPLWKTPHSLSVILCFILFSLIVLLKFKVFFYDFLYLN